MIENQSTSYLRRRRKLLSERLAHASSHVMRGSLIETYKRYGGKSDASKPKRAYGPKYYLSVSQPRRQRPQMDYVPKDYKGQVNEYLMNFRKVRDILEQICNINREILRRRERL